MPRPPSNLVRINGLIPDAHRAAIYRIATERERRLGRDVTFTEVLRDVVALGLPAVEGMEVDDTYGH